MITAILILQSIILVITATEFYAKMKQRQS